VHRRARSAVRRDGSYLEARELRLSISVVGDPALTGTLTSSSHKYTVINIIFTNIFKNEKKIQRLKNTGR